MNIQKVIDVDEVTFQQEVIVRSQTTPVVVDFWAEWCGPCRMLSPLLERLAEEPDSNFILAKVDVDANPRLSRHYRVQGIPAVKGFHNGRVVAEFVGAQPEPVVRAFLERLIPGESERLLGEAAGLLQARRWHEAESAYRQILVQFPDQPQARMGLARALLGQGNGCPAVELLDNLQQATFTSVITRLKPLAVFLCRAAQTEDGTEQPAVAHQYEQAAALLRQGNIPAALDCLLEVIGTDRRYRDGEPKEVMLGLFELLGENDDLTRQYRNKLALILF